MYKDDTFGEHLPQDYLNAVETLHGSAKHPLPEDIIKHIKNIYDFLHGGLKYNDTNRIDMFRHNTNLTREDIDLLSDLLTQPQHQDKLLEAIATVRRLEYYENPEKFPYSAPVLCNIARNSDMYYSEYGEKSGKEYIRETQEGYALDAKRLALTKTLSRIRDKQINTK